MRKKCLYQIALSNPEGIFPQKFEIYQTEEEAKKAVDKYNSQNSNPYAQWVVTRKETR